MSRLNKEFINICLMFFSMFFCQLSGFNIARGEFIFSTIFTVLAGFCIGGLFSQIKE